jgi:hypothetical protein
LDCIEEGALLMQREGGFLFVDVLPAEAAHTPWGARERREAPATFVALSGPEVAALEDIAEAEEPFEAMDEESAEEEAPAMGSGAWRSAREQAGRLRRPPIAA